MRPILLLIPVTLGISPLAAQLSPEQRQAVEAKAHNSDLNQRLQDEWYRSTAGDGSYYYRSVALQERRRLNYLEIMRGLPSQALGNGGHYAHWFALSPEPTKLRKLHPIGPHTVVAQAGTPNVLTIASPIGAPSRALMIHTTVASADPQNGWSRMGVVTADGEGRYLVQVPALAAGNYDLKIEVFDLEHPEAPASESSNRLVVE